MSKSMGDSHCFSCCFKSSYAAQNMFRLKTAKGHSLQPQICSIIKHTSNQTDVHR